MPFQTTMIEERFDPFGDKKPIVSDSLLAYLDQLGAAGNVAYSSIGNGIVGPAFRNALVDGGFEIWDGSRALVPIALNAYSGCTMWRTSFFAAPAQYFVSRQPGFAPGSQFCLRFQRSLGGVDLGPNFLYQNVETFDSLPFAGQRCVLSYWGRAGADYSCVTVDASAPGTGWLRAVVYSGTGVDQNWPTLFNVIGIYNAKLSTLAQPQPFTLAVNVPANSTQLAVVFVNRPSGVAGANDYFEIDNVQLETGSYNTNFEQLPWDVMKSRTERYFWKTFEYDQPPVQNSGTFSGCFNYNVVNAGAAIPYRANIPYGPRLRNIQAPGIVVTTYNPAALNANWRNVTLGADSGVPVTAGFQRNAILINPQVAGDAVGNRIDIHATADARL